MWSAYPGRGTGLSSFIATIPRDFFYYESGSARDAPSINGRPVRRRPAGTFQNTKDDTPYTQGEQVKHPAFGMGVVSRMVSDNKIEVFFKNGGKKLLHLEYTVLEKI